ncbi:hypothetical protein IFM89_020304 [Coptis chinensis]|nr:hypothetical protein IFM89_020304 [Coptis chinensis]
MHFCDIASLALNELYFNVYINGHLATENLDLSDITRMLASPYYADFVVNANELGVISVSIAPSNLSSPERMNAILNGLEIMKMNNSMGSFNGKISVASILRSRARGNNGVGVCSLAIISLLVAAFVVMHRRNAVAQDSVGWSPLPLDASEGNLKYKNQSALRKFLFF